MKFIQMTETGKIEVDIKYLNDLILNNYKLNLLECGGVDNWEWYSESLCGNEDEVITNGKEEFDKFEYAKYLMGQANIFKKEV